MFKNLSNQSTDLTNAIIPVLDTRPNQAIPMESDYSSQQSYNAYESRITSNTSLLYGNFLNWRKIFVTKFPSNFAALPAIITKDNSICLNGDLATVAYNLRTNTMTISEPNDFAASVLYGINNVILKDLVDDNALSEFYIGMTNFIYALIARTYTREIDFTRITNQDIAAMYYCVAKLVLNNYITTYGENYSGIAKIITHNFFTGDLNSRVPYNPGLLPNDVNITGYSDLFKYLDDQNILPSVTMEDFRMKIIQSLSLTAVLCMTNGITLSSMILSCRLPSNVFNERVTKVRPQSSNAMFSAMLRYLTKKVKDSNLVAKPKVPTEWGGWNS